MEHAIEKLKNLELETPEEMKKYIGGQSETGKIATAMDSLYATLREIVSTLRGCSESLEQSVGTMSDASYTLIEAVGDNSATTEELAASITTTNDAIANVVKEIETISELVSFVERRSKYCTGSVETGKQGDIIWIWLRRIKDENCKPNYPC